MQLAKLALLTALIAICSVTGYWTAFTVFRNWDDEGYFLLALRAFRNGGGLYDRIHGVFYGPVYFQFVDACLGIAHVPMDTAGARWLMLAGWMIATLAIARVVWRATGSAGACMLAIALAFPILAWWTNEPLHANTPILIFLALIAVLMTPKRESHGRFELARAALVGALCACVLLVKLNTGVFVLCAFAVTFAPTGPGPVERATRAALALGLVALPFVLMRQLLDQPEVFDFALLVSVSLVPFALLMPRAPGPSRVGGLRIAFVGGALGLTVISLGACLLHGSSLQGMWRALVVDGLNFPLLNHGPLDVPSRGWIVLSSLAIPCAFFSRNHPRCSAVARLAAGLIVLWLSLRMVMPQAVMPFLWFLILGRPTSTLRHLLGVLTVLLVLQAYPIAGSQFGCHFALVPAVGLIGVCDAWRDLRVEHELLRPRWILSSAIPVLAIGVLARFDPFWRYIGEAHWGWTRVVALGLPGTGPLRLPEGEVARYRWVAANLRANADCFVGVPGMHSFYFWAEVEPPVAFYPHHWVLICEAHQQHELLQRLLEHERPCLLANSRLTRFWLHESLLPDSIAGPIADEFEEAGSAGDYELLVPRGRQLDLVLSAIVLSDRQELLERYGAQRCFRLAFPALPGKHLARIVIHDLSSGTDLLDSRARTPERHITVVNELGEELPFSGPDPGIDLSQRSELIMLWPELDIDHNTQALLVRAIDEHGAIFERLLFQGQRQK